MVFALVQTLLQFFDNLLPMCVIIATSIANDCNLFPSETSLSVSFVQSDQVGGNGCYFLRVICILQ